MVRYLTHLAGLSSPPCKIFNDFTWNFDTLYIGISNERLMGPVYLWAFTLLAWGKLILLSRVYSVYPGIFLMVHSTVLEDSMYSVFWLPWLLMTSGVMLEAFLGTLNLTTTKEAALFLG